MDKHIDTVTINLKTYNDLRDFKAKMQDENRVYIESCGHYGTGKLYTTKEKAFEKIKEENKEFVTRYGIQVERIRTLESELRNVKEELEKKKRSCW